MDVKKLTLSANNVLRAALQAINENAQGILFIVNDSNVLIGVLTDGDIRRALINGLMLDSSVALCMSTNFFSLPVTTDNAKILSSINDKIKIIPLVDEHGRVVDFASIHKIHRIPVASPLLDGNELVYVTECIQTNWISSQGRFVREFESQFENYHDVAKAVAVSNGTVAIHLALISLGIGEGDEVIVPDFTFAATINAVLYCNAVPVIVDIDRKTWNISPEAIESSITNKTKAIIPVHLYGLPCDMDSIMAIAKKYGLYVIEDCAEALGSKYKGKPVGSFGDAATFSFFGNKTITTGEGGMVLYKDKEIGEFAEVLRDHGMSKNRRYWHEHVGYNYRMTNIQAAIGVAQIERLNLFVSRKQYIANRYNDTFRELEGFELPYADANYVNSHWLYTVIVSDECNITRDELMEKLSLGGVESRPVFFPLHEMPPYKEYGRAEDLRTSAWISSHGFSLPSSVSLSDQEIDYICRCVKRVFENQFSL